MTKRLDIFTTDPHQQGETIDLRLRELEHWDKPNFDLDWKQDAGYSRDLAHNMLDEHNEVASALTDVDREERARRLAFGHKTVDRWFNEFADPTYEAKRSFVVGRRESEFDDYGHPSESDDFFPSLANENGGTPLVRSRFLSYMPSAVLAQSGQEGLVVLTQLSPDMEIYAKHDPAVIGMGLRAIHMASEFNYRQGVQILGLAGKIAGQSGFGEYFRTTPGVEGMHTTTGHGGTVYLINETVRDAIEREDLGPQRAIGVLGAGGSIGWSTTASLLGKEYAPEKILAFDTRPDKLHKHLEEKNGAYKSRVEEAADILEMFTRADVTIVISAVTTFVDLDELEKKNGISKLDLSGKIFIDDSQPPCFSQEQIESRGGTLLWVVGEDQSEDQFATRTGGHLTYGGRPFAFGGEGIGLAQYSDVFGCEAELAALSLTGKFGSALRGPVTPEQVEDISAIVHQARIHASAPQAYGKLHTPSGRSPSDSPVAA